MTANRKCPCRYCALGIRPGHEIYALGNDQYAHAACLIVHTRHRFAPDLATDVAAVRVLEGHDE